MNRRAVLPLLTTSLLLAACTAGRETTPPEGETFQPPWGAVAIEAGDASEEGVFRSEAVAAFAEVIAQHRSTHPDEKLPLRILALSGGGSKGAYGAGVLTAWSDSGERPEFDVVTGISTGALMAPAAFLGPAWDNTLAVYRNVTNDDIYTSRGMTSILTHEAINDTSPMSALLEETISAAMIDAVAERHRRGHRLFIGTTNLDADVFTIWDMGKIANSEREDRYVLFRDVMLASASFPAAFPPVYRPVEASALSIAEASLVSLMRGNSAASLYAAWTQALSVGATIHLSFIPTDAEEFSALDFEPATMERLYRLGYERHTSGTA